MLPADTEQVHFVFNNVRVALWQPLPAVVQTMRADVELSSALYWARIWPAAIYLADSLSRHPEWVKNKAVLELGAGLGLPSLVAAHYARIVHCTDISPAAMALARQSASDNNLENFSAYSLDWSAIPASVKPDVILLSDINYDPAAFLSLRQVFRRFLRQGATIILVSPQRLMAKSFIDELLPYCIHQQSTGEGEEHPLSLFILSN